MSELRIYMPVRRVTAFEDRAEVTREAEVRLPGGACTIRVPNVTPLTSDAHLRARVEAAAANVDDVRVERRWVAEERADAQRVQALTVEAEGAQDATRAALAGFRRAEERRQAAEALIERYAAQVGRALWSGDGGPERWQAGFEALERGASAAAESVEVARRALREAEEAERRVQAAMAAVQVRRQRLTADLVLRVSGAAGAARIVVSSLVPCALWRPAHEAHLVGADRVRWTTYATVWQSTGEPWTGVELTLSTARPGAGAHLPSLVPDVLRLRDKVPKPKTIFAQHREQAAARPDLSGAAPGVYDGGEARVFRASRPVDVPDDGRPHRIAVGGFETGARVGLLACPELAPQVFLRAVLRNAGEQPLLAGPVTLLRDGTHVGTGDLSYVGAGEGFDLSFGSDDRFRVTQTRRRLEEKRTLGKDRVHFVTEVELTSTGRGAERVEVVLRMPRSELEPLKVAPSEKWCTEGNPVPDADGLVRLPVDVTAGRPRSLSLGFWFDASGDVVVPDPW